MQVLAVRWSIGDVGGAGQAPKMINLVVEARIGDERMHGICSYVSEFNSRQIFVGTDAMRDAWDVFEASGFDDYAAFDEVCGLSYVYKEISDNGTDVVKDDAKYAELTEYIPTLFNMRYDILKTFGMI